MKILASAYACEPGAGSEQGKGWNLALEMARQGHTVTVLTCGSHHRAAIERYVENNDVPDGLTFAWHDIPGWPGPGYENPHRIRQHYYRWQMTARKVAAELHAKNHYDIIHHLTWTVLRWPSFLGGLGPRFIFGPVGGGESAPWRLRQGFPRRGTAFEIKRDLLNLASRLDPMALRCLALADVILVTDEATRRYVPPWWRGKARLVPDIYAPLALGEPVFLSKASPSGPSILFAGRLEYWKGVQFALGAVSRLRGRIPGLSLTIAGTGPDEAYLRAIAQEQGVAGMVRFVGQVPHAEMHRLYGSHDIFLFPSLHDSAGQAIGEAMAHGLPVVCLDLGGPGVAVDSTYGAVVETKAQSRPVVEQRIAEALAQLCSDRDRLLALKAGAFARAEQYSYRRRVEAMVEQFYRPSPIERVAGSAATPQGRPETP